MNKKDWRPIKDAPDSARLLLGWWRYDPCACKEWITEIGYASTKEIAYCPALRERVSIYRHHESATHFQYLPTAPEAA